MRRRAPVLLAVAVAGLLGGFLLVRDASLLAVERVTVVGASGPDAPEIRAALTRAATEMTTANVDGGELRDAVADFPTVRDIEVDRDLPNALTVRVVERAPVAVVQEGGQRVPLAADGTMLRGATAPDDLPALRDATDDRLLSLVAAAPEPLRRRARRAFRGPNGLTLAMSDGPSLWFGRGDRLQAKWAAAARVLADPASEGARYLDLRIPERPAAGGLVVSPSTSGSPSGTGVESPAQPEVEG
jgi:cell division protein FtsQ